MKSAYRLSTLALCLALCLAVGCKPKAPQAPDEAGVHQWLNDFTKAFEARDTKALMALYTPDVIAYDIVPPLQYVGNDAYGKDFENFLSQFKSGPTLEAKDEHVQISGDMAVIESLQHVTGAMNNGQKIDMWVRATICLRNVNGKWLDFHDHISVPTDMATGKSALNLQP